MLEFDFMTSPARVAKEPAQASGPVASVLPTRSAISALRPLSAAGVTLTGGFWGERLAINRERTLGHGFEQLIRAGNLHNLRLPPRAGGPHQAPRKPQGPLSPL